MAEGSGYGNEGCGYIDGEYVAMSDLRLPVTDLGFQLADMCYDALHVWDGRFFRMDDHLDRWERAVAARRYDTLGHDREDFAEVLHGCVARAGLQKSMVTIVATRGTPDSGHKDLRSCRNRLMAWALPYYSAVSDEETEHGCDIVVAETVRIPPDAVDPTIKNYGRLDFVRAMFEAYDREAHYAVLLDQEGNITEGRGWNIFALTGGRLVSPDRGVLEGITRMTVKGLAERLNIDARFDALKVDALRAADEVFLTSTAGGIIPVNQIDDAPVGDGQPGPVTQRLTRMYWDLHDDPAYTTPVRYELAN
ncbi:MAG: aminotransferase class IV [Alphaproteobacteria bacterium]|jgi:branched-chain amino acid aminotransferase|nr:aminotransferase class IV [Alphaproteobacteria bacterium]